MTIIDNRALTLGHRLARLLQALDPEPGAAPLLKLPIRTHDDVFAWDLELSETAVEGLTRILEEVEDRQWSAGQPVLKLVKR
ncbi:hypothetical protein ABZZ74_23445 [Streptomyces sp. NPDC006476]|uniref:hypothetical protein n=1 Tax=Streptomyces sp. NPDC006476 TaxID=3157175 RepID=UPI0033B46D38